MQACAWLPTNGSVNTQFLRLIHQVSLAHTHTNTSPWWIAGAIKRQQRLTCPWKPNRQPKTHINICTSAVATMSKRSLYYMLQRLCLEMTALSCGGGRCKVPVCLPKWPLICKPRTEMHTQCLVCFPKSCSTQRKLHSLEVFATKVVQFSLSVSRAASGLIISNGHQHVIHQSRTLTHPGPGWLAWWAFVCLRTCALMCVCESIWLIHSQAICYFWSRAALLLSFVLLLLFS